VEYLGRLAERDVRPLTVQVLIGVLHGKTEEELNAVNAPAVAVERGIEVAETKRPNARDFSELVRVTIVAERRRTRVVGTNLGRRDRPHLLEAWGQRFNLQLEDHIALFRYEDVPGMIGRVGTVFGNHGVNISSASIGRAGDDPVHPGGQGAMQVMILTTDAPVPPEVVDEIARSDGFEAGRAVSL
jgi:D-3-phosphoglycerate dehydrogenase